MINFAPGNKNMNMVKIKECCAKMENSITPHMCHVSASFVSHYRLICVTFPPRLWRITASYVARFRHI